jgi:hypothetical protein
VGYYEHVWATKRDSTLSKKIFKCDPHRVPSKILEPIVWEKVVSFATHSEFAQRIFEKVKSHHKENPQRQEIERTKAKIFGVNSQIEALSERIAELPKDVSAEPLFRQLAKLQAAQKENEKVLADLKNGSLTNFDRIVGIDTFDDFTEHYKTLVLKDLTVTQKKQFVQKFVKKIEVGVKTYKIHFIVDEEHFKRELALKEAGSQPFGARRLDSQNLFGCFGSNTLTNGAPNSSVTLGIFFARNSMARKISIVALAPIRHSAATFFRSHKNSWTYHQTRDFGAPPIGSTSK